MMKNRIVVITGAGRGVGRATAFRAADSGAQVVLFSRTQAQLAEVAAEIRENGGHALAIAGDVSCEADIQKLFQHVKQTFGRIDVLINCAAIVTVKPFCEMDTQAWDQVMDINLRGTFLCCREAFRLMMHMQQGVIINIASLSGVKGVDKFPGMSAYNVSKSGVVSLSEILAVEGKPYNIRVCAVSPGAIDTDMLRKAAPHLKAGMTAADLAEILLYLADDSGRMFNGSNIELFTNA